MKKLIAIIAAFGMIDASSAGVNGLTTHSRANCGNNESISWDLTKSWTLLTGSDHFYNGKFAHNTATETTLTWRSAAVHWFEASPKQNNWSVIGVHWLPGNTGMYRVLTNARDCSIYDGWWDYNKLQNKNTPATIKPNFENNKNDKDWVGLKLVSKQEIDKINPFIKQANSEGYIENKDNSAELMMKVKERLPSSNIRKTADPYNYYLKNDVSEIRLTFAYNEPNIPLKKLGYAPLMTTIGKSWTGVREFFDDEKGGLCSLQTINLQDSKMGIMWDKEIVTYEVNQYPTTKTIEGNNKYGFVYTISWVDNNYLKTFDCASKTLDKNKIDDMIKLAKKL